jgi:hypothetical protein
VTRPNAKDNNSADGHRDLSPSAPARAAGSYRIIEWKVTSSVYGRGTMLMGPMDEDGQVAVTLAPPGVPLPTPAQFQAPLASAGWRVAWLMAVGDGNIIADEQDPFDLDAMSFEDVVGFVLDHCPQHLGWLAEQVVARARNTAFTLKPDHRGYVPPGAAHREATLIGMLADAEAALSAHAVRLQRIPMCALDAKWMRYLRSTIAPVLDHELVLGPRPA